MSEELCFLTVAEASRLIKARKLSPVELTDAYLGRIGSLDGQLNARLTSPQYRAQQERPPRRDRARPV